jgi:hypothetical protein
VAAAWRLRCGLVHVAEHGSIIMTTWTTWTTWSSVTLGHVATSSTFFFTTSETPLQVPFKTTCLTPVDAILRSVVAEVDRPAGCAAVAPTAGGPLAGPLTQRSRKSRTKSELLSLIFHSVQYLSF